MLITSTFRKGNILCFVLKFNSSYHRVHFILYYLTISIVIYTGFVELVKESETLRKIQVEHGVTGSFKDKTLAVWLQKYNSTELDYQKVSVYIYHPR